MKKILSALLITLVGLPVHAQNKPIACQSEAAAGLSWESGRWVTKSFEPPRFILIQVGKTLTTDSVGKALSTPSGQVTCREVEKEMLCSDRTGGSLYFDPQTLKGGISQLYGSILSGAKKDTVTVHVFSCVPF
jgi:hypothetical protein